MAGFFCFWIPFATSWLQDDVYNRVILDQREGIHRHAHLKLIAVPGRLIKKFLPNGRIFFCFWIPFATSWLQDDFY